MWGTPLGVAGDADRCGWQDNKASRCNSVGQPQTITNAKYETTTFVCEPDERLLSVTRPLPGTMGSYIPVPATGPQGVAPSASSKPSESAVLDRNRASLISWTPSRRISPLGLRLSARNWHVIHTTLLTIHTTLLTRAAKSD